MRRSKDVFDREHDKFTKVLKDIQTKEKIYVEAKKTTMKNNRDSFTGESGAEDQ